MSKIQPVVNLELLEKIGRDLLVAICENPNRPGIKDTPRRWANWWREFIEYDPGKITTVFEQQQIDQVVIVSGMRVWSICEHHILPFWCEIAIGYIPKKKVLGLSKFARIAHKWAHRIQIQERMIQDIALDVMKVTGSKDVAVLGRGEHLCQTTRGIKTQAIMTNSVMKGAFRRETSARAEFMTIVGMNQQVKR